MAVIQRFGPVSALKVGFVVYAFLGLIAGVFCSAIAFAGIAFGPHAYMPLKGILGFLPLILCPLLYGIIGSVVTVVSALIYNLASGWVGGLEVDIH
jgi:hypothetical protein